MIERTRTAADVDVDMPLAMDKPAQATPSPETLWRIYHDAERLYSEAEVAAAVAVMAKRMTACLAESDPLILCLMNGGLITTGLLLPRLNFPLRLDYVHASRYRERLTGGAELEWRARPANELRGQTVLVVDDILDEGHTLRAVLADCLQAGAASVQSAVLVRKRHNRTVPGVTADYVALTVDDRYVFGSGMDYRGYWRNVPGIYAVADENA